MKGKWRIAAAILLAAGTAAAVLYIGGGEQVPEPTPPGQDEVVQPAFRENAESAVLPWQSEDGTLEAETLMAYPDTGEAALMIRNTGSRGISFACVALKQEERTLYFFVTWLPPGGRALVPEYGGQVYREGTITACRSPVIRWERFSSQQEQIHTAMADPGHLAVTNLSNQVYSCVVVHYRLWNEEMQCYLGGSAGAVYLPRLEAGECRWEMWEQDAVIVAVELK